MAANALMRRHRSWWVSTHLLRELSQHVGRLELTRDVLRQA